MRRSWILTGSALLLLTACSENNGQEAAEFASVEEAAPSSAQRLAAEDIQEPRPDTDSSVTQEIAVAAPQIAYRYALGFRLPANAIKPLQTKHADMCEARGASVCRIISMRQVDQDGDYGYGNLQIAVAANVARQFSKELESSSGTSDAELVSSSIEGEDLSKSIVNTEARLRARTLLRDRLMEVLRTRKGTVAELVEAERGVAQVNQEIDQARSWLNEMRGRVAFSQMSIAYESGTRSSGSFSEPIRNAWNSLGGILGSMVAFLMLAITIIAPLALIGFGVHRGWRWSRREESGLSDEG